MPLPVRATYRLQLRNGVDLDRAAEWVPYLARLGVSHLYLSPPFTAAEGSTHGYDVCDPTRVDPALGGEAAMERLFGTLRAFGLGCVVDIVPNHLSTSSVWWRDVLRLGRASPYADWFDVDWDLPDPRMHGRVLVPILAEPLGEAISAGLLRVEAKGEPVLRYRDTDLPLDPGGLDAGELDALNGDMLRLQVLLDGQHYRLAHWRTSASSRNYRRFFDIDTLVGLRAEREDVFEATHRLVGAWFDAGTLDGLRVDHLDGLRDPEAYAERLRARFPGAWIVAEKILGAEERLPPWPIDGTTGYDFLNDVGRLFVDPAGEAPLSAAYGAFAGLQDDFGSVSRSARSLVCERLLDADVDRLVRLSRACLPDGEPPDALLHEAVVEIAAAQPWYRTYLRPGGQRTAADVKMVAEAVETAHRRRPDLAPALRVLQPLLDGAAGGGGEEVMVRFQQFTPAVVAKGDEDTAFYRYGRLLSLNEVGGDPARFGSSIGSFHRANRARQRSWPATMTTTTTHDTKRSEDARVRIGVLSEIPGRWRRTVERWSELNRRHRHGAIPDRNLEWHLYQVLVGAHPIGVERLARYTEKAMREAKHYTSWRNPDGAYEQAVLAFVAGITSDAEFAGELDAFVARLLPAARTTSLAQTLLKLTSPGVPDIYQGCEEWNLTLVDPDNRAPVDVVRLERALDHLPTGPEAILAADGEGRAGASKRLVTIRALEARRRWPEAFGSEGTYTPLAATGLHAHRVVAFQRGTEVVTIVPRLVTGLGETWGGTTVDLPAASWTNLFTGDPVEGGHRPLGEVFARFPVALLARAGQ